MFGDDKYRNVEMIPIVVSIFVRANVAQNTFGTRFCFIEHIGRMFECSHVL